ncbi:two-component regulator propeller domain-containing protein [Plebeiibacterium sediminum]|uniref:histidine kinase n=1 Tax=Plebeiibacterium sediminum TaxID=2992112 RepID=A0AAE3M2F7_9BACT|nr:two-component regulator propeller domain-containing protein [Plebeiobacterium sediminum]MCW3785570.1 ATP-binding protein [Plebeiobacterium sediminum]
MSLKIYLVILFLSVPFLVFSQKKKLFDSNDGLSNSLINELYQDHQGFIWVATEDGLNRFDGINFKAYSKSNQQNSLKNNFITAITEDKKGNLWVAQINALQIYSHEKESLTEIKLPIIDPTIHINISCILEASNGDLWLTTSGNGLIHIDKDTYKANIPININNRLNAELLEYIYEDSDHILWIGSKDNGLIAYNPTTDEITHYRENINSDNSLPSNEVSCITGDDEGYIYIGFLNGGLAKLNKKTGVIEQINSANKNEKALPVKHILLDSKNRLWVGTDGSGLKILNRKTNLLETYISSNTSFDFQKSKVHTIIEDKAGNIWLGIYQKGVYLIPESPEIFINYGYSTIKENSIGSSSITSIDANSKDIWIGTDGDGLYHVKRNSNTITHLPLKDRTGNLLGQNILTIYNDSNQNLWAGRYINGLIVYDKSSQTFKTYNDRFDRPKDNLFNNITAIQKLNDDQLILASLGNGIGRFNIKSKIFQPGLGIPDSLNKQIPQWVISLFIDNDENIWFGTYVGLYCINIKENKLTHFSEENGLLKNNTVNCIQSDSKNNIWIGTYDGLVKLDPKTFKTKIYNTENGICNNSICAIAEDEYEQLWISTHHGLSRFNPKDESFTNYYSYDGIQANEFSRMAVCKTKENELFFGGINGITQIKRDYLNYSHHLDDVLLTEFSLSNKNIKIGDKTGNHTILNKSIVLADTVRIREEDNVFTLGFTSTEIATQTRVNYEYTMKGFDLEWHKTDAQNRRATYTNLNHGIYKFYVRGVYKDQYSTPRELTIIIYPPWYKTFWAKLLWTVFVGLFFYAIVLFYMEKVRHQQSEKVNEMKMQFFINISHEIKTPLSLIIDPLEKLLQTDPDAKTSRLYKLMQQNAYRLLRLVGQMMDIRKIDKGQILMKYQSTNIYNFINQLASSYETFAQDKNIKLSVDTVDPDIEVWIDTLNFEKVIFNLLSNAFKFTPSDGSIEINISRETIANKTSHIHDYIKIDVSDTGIGIKESDQQRIFDRFYQANSEETRHAGGTGIGLHLSKSLVNLHKGELTVTNRKDQQGSVFTILLPVGNKHLPKEDLLTQSNVLPTPGKIIPFESQSKKADSEDKTKPKTHYKIMVVDDEVDIRNYLVTELSPYYKIVACEDGQKAHSIVIDEKPDLIISDIMMPRMDGITLCKRIKSNILTNHIPVILLTALSKEEDKNEGIETGADMYLIKPFNTEFLKKIIDNILENRSRIYQKLQPKAELEIDNIEQESHNEVLLQKVMTVIKNKIGDSDLNVEILADEIGISRVHMHRKLKELTNQSARDLIKNIRMKQAAYLLTTQKTNISEVAYAVGFTNLSHFSKSFKTYYGVSPKEYILKQHKIIDPSDLEDDENN